MFQAVKSRPSSRWLLAGCLLLLSACGSRPPLPSQDVQQQKLEDAMASGVYKPARIFAIDSGRDVWIHDGTELEVEMTAPSAAGRYPLIIYLPSLGEDAGAGHLWREAWAKAGYAVFSMQPLAVAQALKALEAERRFDDPLEMPDDEEFEPGNENGESRPEPESGGWFGDKPRRQSRTARASELRYVGHQYFATENLKQRMAHLFWAYRQLKIRADLHQPLYAAADWSKPILAGYDLGAQTVTAALGENFGTGLPEDAELKPVAALVLSPSVDLAEGNVKTRFQKLTVPMLAVTGSEDDDPYSISSPSVRTALWEHAPAGGKYLLLLQGAGHRLLAGSEMGGRFGRRGEGRFGGGPDGMAGGPGAGRRGGPGAGGPSSGGMAMAGLGRGDRRNPDLGYQQVAAIIGTSTAFLDFLIKQDEFAQAWLNGNANKWLNKAGSLQAR